MITKNKLISYLKMITISSEVMSRFTSSVVNTLIYFQYVESKNCYTLVSRTFASDLSLILISKSHILTQHDQYY